MLDTSSMRLKTTVLHRAHNSVSEVLERYTKWGVSWTAMQDDLARVCLEYYLDGADDAIIAEGKHE